MYLTLFKSLAVTSVIAVTMITSVLPTHRRVLKQDNPQERVVRMIDIRNSPVKLTDVRIGDVSIAGKKQITATRQIGDWVEFNSVANADWLASIAFTLKNSSERPIVALNAELQIEHPGIGVPVSLPLTPSNPLPAFLNKEQEIRTDLKTLMPGEEVNYHLSSRVLGMWEAALTRFNTSGSPSVVELNILRVQFDSNTGWSGGETFIRNPANPSNWVPERRIGNRKNKEASTKAAHARAPRRVSPSAAAAQSGGCRNSSDDLLFNCFSMTEPCQGLDQNIGNDFGPYKLVQTLVTCYDSEFNPCNTTLEYGTRRRVNLNCSA